MIFRPALAMTAATIASLIVLVMLGVWQLQRLEWKLDLIAKIETRTDAAPVAFEDGLGIMLAGEDAEYLPVRLEGVFDHDNEIHLYANYEGAQGYFVITPLMREDAPAVLINRGFVPSAYKDPSTRPTGLIEGPVAIEGLFRISGDAGAFTPDDQPEDNIWFTRDAARMAAHLGVAAAPAFVDSDGAENLGGWPQGGVTRIEFRNSHLGYAITWFGLAAALLGVYVAYHVKTGRLRFTA